MDDAPTPEQLAQKLVDLLDVEEIDTDLYRGRRGDDGDGRVFGGQVLAQALQAAQRSADADKAAHSLHAYFMRPGAGAHPIIYRVVRDFDGKSFATRRVIATQKGVPILTLTCSLQRPEAGLAHQDIMPDVPAPEALKSDLEIRIEHADHIPESFRANFMRPRMIESRPVNARNWFSPEKQDPHQVNWFRVVAPVADDAALHRAILTYASDMSLLGTATLPHGVNWMTHNLQSASLDHTVWLHEDFRADDWLLYVCDSPWAGHARGFNRGKIFARDGRLVASVAQEGLMRLRE
ncbi:MULTISPECIES: acyl-CoA thioesterase [Sphingomonas]|uniref:Acyl-CoA thioesterase II n=1 Tax=Sphingomonas psychrolutea TaxID=1259676 RepID=A0ABQ1GSZ1_9SPHN|nr:acyl-CoA thioesterase II [Sphingomonas psychrolutea]GGA49859.1 acyl-CoA thioesterase II [Sphingomonas psychrolutea]